MKRLLILSSIVLSALLTVQCGEKEPFDVAIEQESVKVKAGTPATVSYTVANNSGPVTVSLSPAVEGIKVENSFSGTKGTITFTTTLTDNLDKSVQVVFNDTKETVGKNLQIHVSSSWGVEPSDPSNQ